jgi:hypothetical protein
MRALVLILLLAAAPAFAAQRIVREGADEVRVFDSPCVSAQTMALIRESERHLYGKAQGTIGGERFFGCWRAFGDSVYILWDDGDGGVTSGVTFADSLGLASIRSPL